MASPSRTPSRKIGVSHIISVVSLLLAITAVVLALRKPQPVVAPQTPAVIAANAQSFQAKVDQLAQANADGQAGAEVHLSSNEVTAAIAQASGTVPSAPVAASTEPTSTSAATPADLSASLGAGAIDLSNMPEPIVSFEGDQLKGQFLTEIGGKKVYVTLAGHLGSKDGYANFEPTEFKVGDLNVPVSLVNDALQKKMLEQRDRLKLPDYVKDIHVENGELVIKQK